MKKYISIFILFFSSFSLASEFEEAFDMPAQGFSRQANRVVAYLDSSSDADMSQQDDEFDYISKSLLKIESSFNLNPGYWFVRGLHAKNLISFNLQKGDVGNISSLVKEKNKYYAVAMDLDKKYSPHLSANAYAAMKSGLPAVLKQQAIKAELALGGSGENESYYWYLHWSNVNELQKQGRMGDAEQALENMKKELKNSGQEHTFKTLVKKIGQQLKEKKQAMPAADTKLGSVRNHTSFTEEGVDEEYYRYVMIVLGIMLVLIVVAVMLEIKRRKSK